jgi:pimeloyl-ACP methyl ester carboxylesterase
MREFDVDAGDGRVLHGYDVGTTGRRDELTLLWHHGTPNIGSPPEPLFNAAAALGIRWIGYDRPGYGGSTSRPGASVAAAADDAVLIADRLGVDTFAVLGHSGGGARALACGARLPERVIAVVSISSPAPWPAEDLDYFAGMSTGSVRQLHAAIQGRDELAAVLADAEFDPESFTAADEEALGGEWAWFDGIVNAATANGLGGMIDDDVAAMAPWGFDLGRITAPTLVVHGTADRMVPSSHGRWLAHRCPTAKLWLPDGDGHISVLTSAPAALAWVREKARPSSAGPRRS